MYLCQYIYIHSIILLPPRIETQQKMRKSVMTDVSTWHLSMLALLGKTVGPLEAARFPDAMDMQNWYEPRQSGQAAKWCYKNSPRRTGKSWRRPFGGKERWLSLNNAKRCLLTGATASFADGRTWGQSIDSPFIHSFLASCCFFFNLTVTALSLCFEPFLDGGLHHGAARSLQFSSFWIAEKVCPCGGSGLDRGWSAPPLNEAF